MKAIDRDEPYKLLEAEIRWVLNFGEGELQPDTDWDRLNFRLRRCARSFLEFGSVSCSVPRFISKADVFEIHGRLRRILDGFWPKDGKAATSTAYFPTGIEFLVLDKDGKEIWPTYIGKWPNCFSVGIAAVFMRFGPQIARCQAPDCRRLFLRIRRQTYCSPECSQRVRSAAWYKTHRDEARERRRRAYERQMRRKQSGAKLASSATTKTRTKAWSSIGQRRTT